MSWIPHFDESQAKGNRNAENGFPDTVVRTPLVLVQECQRAFDAGLLIAASTLAVMIPDVCANLAGTGYREWCEKYMELSVSSEEFARGDIRTQGELRDELDEVFTREFSASDMQQLRNALLHASSVVIKGKGDRYTPYNAIGLVIHLNKFDSLSLIGSRSKVTQPEKAERQDGNWSICKNFDCEKPYEEGCPIICEHHLLKSLGYQCDLNLDVLITLVTRGVAAFLREHPELNKEQRQEFAKTGIVDFRPMEALQDQLPGAAL